MGFFDFLKGLDINQGVKEYNATDGAVLLDVRTPDEYRGGHIPGSKNVPLQSIEKVAGIAASLNPPPPAVWTNNNNPFSYSTGSEKGSFFSK